MIHDCALGNLGITLGASPDRKVKERGWEYVGFPEKRVWEDLAECLLEIESAVNRLGGVIEVAR